MSKQADMREKEQSGGINHILAELCVDVITKNCVPLFPSHPWFSWRMCVRRCNMLVCALLLVRLFFLFLFRVGVLLIGAVCAATAGCVWGAEGAWELRIVGLRRRNSKRNPATSMAVA